MLALFVLLLFWIAVLPVITGKLMEKKSNEMLIEARIIHQAMEKMASDGEATGDRTLGYPADAGIATVADLKKRLVEHRYLTEEQANTIHFDLLRIGNVSKSDKPKTIVIRFPSEQQGLSAVLWKSGDSKVLQPDVALAADNPPRSPAFLP